MPKRILSLKHGSRDIKIVTKNRGETISVVSNKAIAKEIKSTVSSYIIGVKEKVLDSSFNVKEQKQYAFLERYYSVFDSTNDQVGFAVTENTNSTAN